MRRWIAAFLALLLFGAADVATAQNVPIFATGTLTPGHALVLQQTGTPGAAVVKDAGPALAGNFTELGITNNGTPLCVRDLAQTHLLCFGALALGGGLISYNPIGNATPLGLTVNLNGTNYPFPGSGNGNVIGPTSPTPPAGDIAIWNGGTTITDGGSSAVNITASVFGGKGDGSTNNVPAWNAAVATLPASGGTIFLPPGKFVFNSAVAYAFSAGVGSLTVQCSGPDVTQLQFPNSTDGFDITSSSSDSGVHFRDCSIETGSTGGGNGIVLTQNANLSGAPMVATSDITNTVFHGIDGYIQNDYWGTGVKVIGWSNVNYINTHFFGANGGSVPLGTGGVAGPLGYGVTLAGHTTGGANTIAAVHNFTGDYFSGVQYGIVYGTDTQGVTVSQSNFTGIGINGILVGCPTSPGIMYSTDYSTPAVCSFANIDQLNVSNSQFGYSGGSAILVGYNIGHLMLTANLFYQAGVNYSVELYGGLENVVTGNSFAVLTDTKTKVVSAFTGSISGTTLTASGVTNAIKVGDTIYAGPAANVYPIATGTTIVSQLTGPTGGAGTYRVSISQSVSSTAMNSYPAFAGVGALMASGNIEGGTITANHFTALPTAVFLSPSAPNFVVANNRYDFIGTKVSASPFSVGLSTPVYSVCDASIPWTVHLFDGATNETLGSGVASYHRCGDLVFYSFGFNNPTIAGTGNATIQGFPFPATNEMGVFSLSASTTCAEYAQLNSATGITGYFSSGTSTLNLVIPGAAASAPATNSTWNSNSVLQCSGVYYTAAP